MPSYASASTGPTGRKSIVRHRRETQLVAATGVRDPDGYAQPRRLCAGLRGEVLLVAVSTCGFARSWVAHNRSGCA